MPRVPKDQHRHTSLVWLVGEGVPRTWSLTKRQAGGGTETPRREEDGTEPLRGRKKGRAAGVPRAWGGRSG